MIYKFGKIDVLNDSRINCLSVVTTISIRDYIDLVVQAYSDRGGIIGQRDALKTTSAIRIRRRMVSDIQQGAVLPPVVLGLVLETASFTKISGKSTSVAEIKRILSEDHQDRLSIIDGMQRTTAILEAFEGKTPPPNRMIRVEFWVANDVGSLIYRMLVLNTGQVPWNLRRQVEVVFRSLVLDLKKNVEGLSILTEKSRRVRGGQFQGDELVELYLVFGARKEKVDIKERLADEFTRLDFMEVADNDDFSGYFRASLQCLVNLDSVIDRKLGGDVAEGRFKSGKDLFSSQPACVGLITAIALEIFGRPGTSRGEDEQQKKMTLINKNVSAVIKKLEDINSVDAVNFMRFQTLNESLPKSRTQSSIGDSEREYFLKAFQVLLEEGAQLDSFEACWRAY